MFTGNYHMPQTASRNPDAVNRFWDKFVNNLIKQDIGEPFLRWHVKRAEQYLKAYSDKKLAAHTAADVNGYLENLGRKGDVKEWQFRQAVDAIQNLFFTAGIRDLPGVDWHFWRKIIQDTRKNNKTIT
jgi:hypothetical protein